uniref:(northern house mosquito) hypothetical protein n=1 Tax=Culex pipiens TaxID=7175 RepID=A0A8D8C0C5_CULPI
MIQISFQKCKCPRMSVKISYTFRQQSINITSTCCTKPHPTVASIIRSTFSLTSQPRCTRVPWQNLLARVVLSSSLFSISRTGIPITHVAVLVRGTSKLRTSLQFVGCIELPHPKPVREDGSTRKKLFYCGDEIASTAFDATSCDYRRELRGRNNNLFKRWLLRAGIPVQRQWYCNYGR